MNKLIWKKQYLFNKYVYYWTFGTGVNGEKHEFEITKTLNSYRLFHNSKYEGDFRCLRDAEHFAESLLNEKV
jgi:hypothetical protein